MASPVDTPSLYLPFEQIGWNRRVLTDSDLIKLCKMYRIGIAREPMISQGAFLTKEGRAYIVISDRLTGIRALFVSLHCLAHAIMHSYFLNVTQASIPVTKSIYALCDPIDDLSNGILACGTHGTYAAIFASVGLMPRLVIANGQNPLRDEDTNLYNSFVQYRQNILTQYGH